MTNHNRLDALIDRSRELIERSKAVRAEAHEIRATAKSVALKPQPVEDFGEMYVQ